MAVPAVGNAELILEERTVQEIMQELYRMFQLHTEHISLHADTHGIIIHIFPPAGLPFHCPTGPIDVRLQEDKYEVLGPNS